VLEKQIFSLYISLVVDNNDLIHEFLYDFKNYD
jgi:hypothetical protein